MEPRCPFCYSNKVRLTITQRGEDYWECNDCNKVFNDDYVLYANPKKSRINKKRDED